MPAPLWRRARLWAPSAARVRRYLGICESEHKDMLWIAREARDATKAISDAALARAGLGAWTVHTEAETGKTYFHNSSSGVTSWEHPLDQHFRKLVTHLKEKVNTAHGKLTGLAHMQGVAGK